MSELFRQIVPGQSEMNQPKLSPEQIDGERRFQEFLAFQKALSEQLAVWEEDEKEARTENKEVLALSTLSRTNPETLNLSNYFSGNLISMAESIHTVPFLFSAAMLWDNLREVFDAESEKSDEQKVLEQLEAEAENEPDENIRQEKYELVAYLDSWHRSLAERRDYRPNFEQNETAA